MPVICTVNMKKRNMVNMMEFTIDEIYDKYTQTFMVSQSDDEKKYDKMRNIQFKINNEVFDKSEFRSSFLPNFCNTVYKYQGGKIDEHYNIYDTHKMDIKEMYPCLSRTTKLEYIHLDSKKKKDGIVNVNKLIW